MRANRGRLEVLYGGEWGGVCLSAFDPIDAGVVCGQLQLGAYGNGIPATGFGIAPPRVWLDRVQCTGNEDTLQQCQSLGWGVYSCDASELVAVECSAAPLTGEEARLQWSRLSQ